MLHEIVGVTDEPPAKRRWFHNEYFDLFVWQSLEGEVTQFQLCYGVEASERALVWHRHGGFFHDGFVPGEHDVPGAAKALVERFTTVAPTLPKMIRHTVESRLVEYSRKAEPVRSRRQSFRRAAWQKRLKSSSSEAASR